MAQRMPAHSDVNDEHRYETNALPPMMISGICSSDYGQCLASLRLAFTYLTGSFAWSEAQERCLIEACMAALQNHGENLEV